MRDLELELHDLGPSLDFPATPDVVARVRPRVHEPTRRRWSRALAVVVAVAIAAVLVGLAIPDARTALLRVFGIGSVRVEYVDRLPEVQVAPTFDPGTRTRENVTPFPILRSDLLGKPDAVYSELGVVTLLYGTPLAARLLVTELEGSELRSETVKKLLTVSSRVEAVRIGDREGLWIEGEPHAVFLPGAPPRLAANTLVWLARGLTLRIEGAASREQAIRIAESFR